jgi:hypothetical protein
MDGWIYEGNLIVGDMVMFFLVGRLYHEQAIGVDHLAWIVTALVANIYSSYINTFPFLQHSFTLYEMHCTWPWATWIFVLIITPMIGAVIIQHIQFSFQHGILISKLIEIMISAFLLLAPLLTSPYFHFHHWFAGLLLGMHCNFNTWWSRCAMAWCWGLYINGIAVYGRDPVLTCGYAYYVSTSQHCPFLSCYLYAMAHPPTQAPVVFGETAAPNNEPIIEPMVKPDWKNCSATDAYKP